MNQDDLDRALSESREIRVSDDFATSVMARVRTEAKAPPPLVFPLKRLSAGLGTCVVLLVVAVWITLTAGPSEWVHPGWIDPIIATAQSVAVQWTVVALLASLMSFRWSMRLAGCRN